MDRIHADRREPSTPREPLDLDAAVDDLLATAAEQSAGRAARTLTPGTGSRLKQTLVALRRGRVLDDHVAPGQATLQLLRGDATLSWEGGSWQLPTGCWVTIPSELHQLEATSDTAALITTVTDT